MNNILLIPLLVLLISCTSITVKEVDPSLQVSHVCIQDNPKVVVSEFISVVRDGFGRHGISTEIYEGNKPKYCEYNLTYTALKHWDLGMYMHHAELQLYRGNKQVAYAEYRLKGKGGLALNKWASVDSKMDPVINKLLSGYSPEMVEKFRKTIPNSREFTIEDADGKLGKLRKLKSWFDEGLITDQEYNMEKQKVLNQ